jgi:hypothetical protein
MSKSGMEWSQTTAMRVIRVWRTISFDLVRTGNTDGVLVTAVMNVVEGFPKVIGGEIAIVFRGDEVPSPVVPVANTALVVVAATSSLTIELAIEISTLRMLL